MYNKEYLDAIKKKLDVMNQLSGFNPNGHGNIKGYDNYDSFNDAIGGIGAAGKAYMERNPHITQEIPQIENPNTGLIFS